MARTPRKQPGTAVVDWEKEMEAQAQVAVQMERKAGGGQFFSVKNGRLQFDGAEIPGGQIAVVIVDHILENAYYEGRWDPDNPSAPVCFAFGRDEDTMGPHPDVDEKSAFTRQSDDCASCPMNVYGTADTGKGKACKNTRRLAMIPAGTYDKKGDLTLFEDEDHFRKAPIAFLKLPTTSINGWAAFVKQVAGTLKRPPHGIFTNITVVPDPKTQVKVLFEGIEKVPGELLGVMMERHKEAQGIIEQPYQPAEETAKPAGRGRAAPKGNPRAPAGRGSKPAPAKRKY